MGECGPTATKAKKGSSGWAVIADGGMRANCNEIGGGAFGRHVIADGGMRANCNPAHAAMFLL